MLHENLPCKDRKAIFSHILERTQLGDKKKMRIFSIPCIAIAGSSKEQNDLEKMEQHENRNFHLQLNTFTVFFAGKNSSEHI